MLIVSVQRSRKARASPWPSVRDRPPVACGTCRRLEFGIPGTSPIEIRTVFESLLGLEASEL